MFRKFRYLVLFLIGFITIQYKAHSQDISAMEYFIDSDPGIGMANSISITGGANIDETFTINTSSLPVGFHRIVFRVQDLNGIWSISNSRNFYVSASNLSTTADISDLEYFIDLDPGFGNGTPISISTSSNIDINSIISTATLSVGFHRLHVRAQDSDGLWSNISTRSFYIANSNLTTQSNITALEYYVDTDPGFGNGSPLTITAATNIDISSVISTSSLAIGFHRLHVRAQDSDGQWSNISTRSFYIANADLTTQANIITMEYYFDTDPGFGAGTSLSISSGTTIDFSSNLPTSSLSAGYHELYVRALDVFGNWSEVESRSFLIDQYTSGNISSYEYFFDSDPGVGNSTNVPVPPTNDLDEILNIPANSLSVGSHELGIRLINEHGLTGLTDYHSVTVCDVASPDFVPDIVCVGSATTFTDTSISSISGDIFSWDFDGDATADLVTTSGDQSFTFSSSGIFNSTLSIDRSGCIRTATVQVQVEAAPSSDAGPNQSICNTSTTMAANIPSTNETGIWSIVSGSATIMDQTNPTTSITDISTNVIELVWTLTNTIGACNDQSTVQVTANLPITAASQATSVDIGQTINLDVQSVALINPNDVLTTSITTSPLNGSAIVLSDGTIEYTPNQNATGSDAIVYRITNQCDNFDENSIDITINNTAPIIDIASIEAVLNVLNFTFDLSSSLSDPNSNLDLSTLAILSQPISGATASVDSEGILTIDYTGIIFSGTDQLEIEICDFVGLCTSQVISILNVETGNPPISVFNAVSPNGDGFHDFLEIENIESYPNNLVVILNRSGNEVARFNGYNNASVSFSDTTLPSGIYYYFIVSGVSEVSTVKGHFVLKTD